MIAYSPALLGVPGGSWGFLGAIWSNLGAKFEAISKKFGADLELISIDFGLISGAEVLVRSQPVRGFYWGGVSARDSYSVAASWVQGRRGDRSPQAKRGRLVTYTPRPFIKHGNPG